MTHINLFRYRVPVIRRNSPALVADAELREHVYVHAPNAIAAQLLGRAVTGAETALEPERLGEVESPRPMLAQSTSGLWTVFA